MKNTKKNLSKLADHKFSLFEIKEDGSRGLHYGGLSGICLVDEVFKRLSLGIRVVVVLEGEGTMNIYREIYGSVTNNSQTDPQFFEKILPFSVDLRKIIKD